MTPALMSASSVPVREAGPRKAKVMPKTPEEMSATPAQAAGREVLAEEGDAEEGDERRGEAAHQRIGAAHVGGAVGAGDQREVEDLHDGRDGEEGPARAGRQRQEGQDGEGDEARGGGDEDGGEELVGAALDDGVPGGVQRGAEEDGGEDGGAASAARADWDGGRMRPPIEDERAARERAISAGFATSAGARRRCEDVMADGRVAWRRVEPAGGGVRGRSTSARRWRWRWRCRRTGCGRCSSG